MVVDGHHWAGYICLLLAFLILHFRIALHGPLALGHSSGSVWACAAALAALLSSALLRVSE